MNKCDFYIIICHEFKLGQDIAVATKYLALEVSFGMDHVLLVLKSASGELDLQDGSIIIVNN